MFWTQVLDKKVRSEEGGGRSEEEIIFIEFIDYLFVLFMETYPLHRKRD